MPDNANTAEMRALQEDMPVLGGGLTPVQWLRSIATGDDKVRAFARAREGRAIADWIEALLKRESPNV